MSKEDTTSLFKISFRYQTPTSSIQLSSRSSTFSVCKTNILKKKIYYGNDTVFTVFSRKASARYLAPSVPIPPLTSLSV